MRNAAASANTTVSTETAVVTMPRLESIDLASPGRLASSRAPMVVTPKSVISENSEMKTRAVTSDP
jgi:hypothetical protein